MDRFNKTLHGYNPEEVNKFLDDIIIEVEKIIASNKEKNKEIISLQKELEELKKNNKEVIIKAKKYDELKDTLNEAINMAKDTGEHMRSLAKQERNLIIEEARNNANIIMNDAIKRSSDINYQAEMLRKNIINFKKKYKIDLEDLLEKVNDIEIIDINNK